MKEKIWYQLSSFYGSGAIILYIIDQNTSQFIEIFNKSRVMNFAQWSMVLNGRECL